MTQLLDPLLERRLQARRLAIGATNRLSMLVDHLAGGLQAIGLLAILFHLDDAQPQKLNLGLRIGQHLVGFRQQLLVAANAQRLDHVLRPGLHLHLDLQLLLRSADQETAIGIDACSYRFCKK